MKRVQRSGREKDLENSVASLLHPTVEHFPCVPSERLDDYKNKTNTVCIINWSMLWLSSCFKKKEGRKGGREGERGGKKTDQP